MALAPAALALDHTAFTVTVRACHLHRGHKARHDLLAMQLHPLTIASFACMDI